MFNLVTIPDENNPNNIKFEPYVDVFINNPNSVQTELKLDRQDRCFRNEANTFSRFE